MGLAVEVGYLADVIENDEEGADQFREDLASLNEFLSSVGLSAHQEPEACEVLSYDMFGYSGLHYLRRIAAHLDLRGQMPSPGDEHAAEDKTMAEYYRLADKGTRGFLGRLFGRKSPARTFDHLMLNSDAEGYYLPQEFSAVLFPPDEFPIPGGMIGSSYRLQEECQRLATVLQLPLDLDPESKEVWEAADSGGEIEGETQWKRYGIESFVCLRLYKACQHSLKHGAAIVFC